MPHALKTDVTDTFDAFVRDAIAQLDVELRQLSLAIRASSRASPVAPRMEL